MGLPDTQRVLRATTAYNNFFSYDVQTTCERVTNKTLKDNLKGPFDTGEVNNCKLIGGYATGLLEYAEDRYNFKTELVTNIWAHDFQSAYNHSIDLYVGGYVLNNPYGKFPVAPTVPVQISRITAVFNHEHDTYGHDIILQPFDTEVWCFVWAIISCIILLTILFNHISKKLGISNFLTQDAVFEIYSCVVINSGEHELSGGVFHFRLLVFVSSMTAMIMNISYSSSLCANLSTISYNVQTLQDLINSNYELLVTVGCTNCSGVYSSIKKASETDLLAQQLMLRKSDMSFVYDTFEKAIYAVRDIPLAFFTYHDVLDDIIQKYIGEMPCSWTKLPVLNIYRHRSMLVRQDSSYREEMNRAFIKARETGVMNYQLSKWMPPEALCGGKSKLPIVNMQNLYWVYVIFGIGAMLSLLILFVESKWKKMRK